MTISVLMSTPSTSARRKQQRHEHSIKCLQIFYMNWLQLVLRLRVLRWSESVGVCVDHGVGRRSTTSSRHHVSGPVIFRFMDADLWEGTEIDRLGKTLRALQFYMWSLMKYWEADKHTFCFGLLMGFFFDNEKNQKNFICSGKIANKHF